MKKILSLFLLLSFPVIVYGSTNWTNVAPNNYIDYETVVGSEDIYGFTFLLKSFNKGQYEPINEKSIMYTLSQYTINCSDRTYKIGVIDSYDKNENFVYGDYNKYASFQPIIGGTAVEIIANKLCRN